MFTIIFLSYIHPESMQTHRNYIKILIINILTLLPCFTIASRSDSACNIVDLEKIWCNSLSSNYTKPYCVTNFYETAHENSDVNYARTCILPALTNQLSKKDNNFSTRNAIQNFCAALLWRSDTWRIYFSKPDSLSDSNNQDNWDWKQTFDSHQSLFLHALCWSFTEKWTYPFLTENTNIQQSLKWNITDRLALKQISSDWRDLCSLEDNYAINNCDMSIYASKIYSGIMSDLFKIMYAQVLDVDDVDTFEATNSLKSFMSGYYMINDEPSILESTYPKTIDILKSNQSEYKNVLDSIIILDNPKLANLASSTKCPNNKMMTGDNFIACALHAPQWNGFALNPAFVTLLYNEILHYRLFVEYYESRPNKLEYENESSTVWSDLKLYSNKQIEATKSALHKFEEFNMTYPLHIRTLMYIEKAETFRNQNFPEVISTFYSLSEKLQNVQIPN